MAYAALPQTLPGTPLPNVDPTVEDLGKITTAAHIWNWLGVAPAVSKAMSDLMFGEEATPALRDIVLISHAEYEHIIGLVKVPKPGAASSGTAAEEGQGVQPQTRELAPIEKGKLFHFRRIARLRLGLPARDDVPELPIPTLEAADTGEGHKDDDNKKGDGKSTSNVAEPKIKLRDILDRTLDSELVRVPYKELRSMYGKFSEKAEDEPDEERRPTAEQLGALAQVVGANLPPYADFALFGPNGQVLIEDLYYEAKTYDPATGEHSVKRLPGPGNIWQYNLCYRVWHTSMVILGYIGDERCRQYGEKIERFDKMYPDCWDIIYSGCKDTRKNTFQRVRMDLDNRHEKKPVPGYDPERPWHHVMRLVLGDKDHWDETIHRPCMQYLARIKSRAELTHKETAQSHASVELLSQQGRQRGPRKGKQAGGNTDPSAPAFPPTPPFAATPRVPKGRPPAPSNVASNKGQAFCASYASPQGCTHSQQTCPYLHGCTVCKTLGHIPGDLKCRGPPQQKRGREDTRQDGRQDGYQGKPWGKGGRGKGGKGGERGGDGGFRRRSRSPNGRGRDRRR